MWPHQHSLPTITRALPSKRPMKNPAGISQASQEAIQRWHADRHMFQVYHYEHSNMVWDANAKQYVLPSAEECEVCLGIDKLYTLHCVKEHFESSDTFIKRRQLLGNSFNCSVIAFLLTHWLHDRSYQKSIPPVDICCNTITCNKPFMAAPSATAPTATSDETAVTLVKEYMRIAEKGGSDVRLELGVPFRPNAWPRAGAQVHRWNWSIVHGFPWRNSNNVHINKLELLAVLSTIKWRHVERVNNAAVSYTSLTPK